MNTARHTPLKQLCPPDKTSIKPQGTQLPEKGWREGGGQEGGREKEEFGYVSGSKVAVQYTLRVQISHG